SSVARYEPNPARNSAMAIDMLATFTAASASPTAVRPLNTCSAHHATAVGPTVRETRLSTKKYSAAPWARSGAGTISATAADAAPHGNAAKKFTTPRQTSASAAVGMSASAVADTSIPTAPMIPTRSGPSTWPRPTNQSAVQPPASTPTTPIDIVISPIALPVADSVMPYVRKKNVGSQATSAKLTRPDIANPKLCVTNVRRLSRTYLTSTRSGRAGASAAAPRRTGSRTVRKSRATRKPGSPTARNTDCQGRMAPSSGTVRVPATSSSSTTTPLRK